jgi:hypothetical protein
MSGERTLRPLNTAHWVDNVDDTSGSALTPAEHNLAGDFFCAPFGASDIDEGPAHGWSANSAWSLVERGSGSLCLALDREVQNSRISKTLRLANDAPCLYQSHVIDGGNGSLPIAHHPMVSVCGRGFLSVSPKRLILSPETPMEVGRNKLACAQQSTDLRNFPAKDGTMVDLTSLPIGDQHEDFVTLIEALESQIGWTAIIREIEDDLVFILKDPAVLPVTMLWHSNGGRDYSPWNGKHTGVIGVEDGCAAGLVGHRAALAENTVSREGIPTAVTLGGRNRIAHVIGTIPRPTGWTRINQIVAQNGQLTLTEQSGETTSLPFKTDFFSKDYDHGNR